MKILIINGPNLNLTGIRETSVYGTRDMDSIINYIRQSCADATIDYFQSNHEGEIIDRIQLDGFGQYDGIVINPGAYSHYSLAIADAISAIATPVIEVHLSNIFAREDFRKVSVTGARCLAVISGLGADGYRAAIDAFRHRND